MEQAGIRADQRISSEQILQAIGERNYHMLRDATEAVVSNVDKFVERGNELRAELIKAFSSIFSSEEILNFELLEKPVANIYSYNQTN